MIARIFNNSIGYHQYFRLGEANETRKKYEEKDCFIHLFFFDDRPNKQHLVVYIYYHRICTIR